MTDTTTNGAQRPLEEWSQGELLARHAELIRKGNGTAQGLDDPDLEQLVAIFAVMRRRSSGPPSAKKTTGTRKPEGALEDML